VTQTAASLDPGAGGTGARRADPRHDPRPVHHPGCTRESRRISIRPAPRNRPGAVSGLWPRRKRFRLWATAIIAVIALADPGGMRQGHRARAAPLRARARRPGRQRPPHTGSRHCD
jgi:hypothetical protein